jgi:hypothetical protein
MKHLPAIIGCVKLWLSCMQFRSEERVLAQGLLTRLRRGKMQMAPVLQAKTCANN